MSQLFTPFSTEGLALKNRIVMPPMCTYQVADGSGMPGAFHQLHYGARALGGVGLIIVEATGVEARGRISDHDLGLWSDTQIAGHRALVETLHHHGTKVALQLGHAGRKSECTQTRPIAPSALPFSKEHPTPEALSEEEITEIAQAFVQAARRAEAAGYDALELHAAHGYLLTEFLSPLSNQRSDRYGGSLENRCRLIIEIAEAIKAATDQPLIVRISATEWVEGGWDLSDSIFLSQALKRAGAAIIHVSAGGNHPAAPLMPPMTPGYQAAYAAKIRQATSLPVIAVGGLTSAGEGEALLTAQACDLVAYGRELLRSPNFAFYAARVLDEPSAIHPSLKRAF